MNFFQTFYVTHFSKPASDRIIYRTIQADHPRKIMEIGIQKGCRTTTLLQMVLRYSGEPSDVNYCVIDPFEGRKPMDGPGLSLRKAHRMINSFGVKSRLDPQPPEMVIRQFYLNRAIEKVDLLIVATPTYDWLRTCNPHFLELIHESAGIFIGQRSVHDGPFHFEKYGFSEFEQILHNPGLLNQSFQKAAA